MKTVYTILFDLTVTHNYFKSGFCEGLNYMPSRSTQGLMDRYNLRLQVTDRGFQFYSPRKVSLEYYLNYITKATGISSFEFDVRTLYGTFYQFTDLSLNQLGELLFNSSNTKSDNDFFVLEKQFQRERVLAKDLFTLTVNFSDLIKAEQAGEEVLYKIEFFSRATQWQYNVINNSHQHVGELSIKGDLDVEFDTGKETILQNGQKATSFLSLTSDITFSEVPKYQFDLINTTEILGRKKVKTLLKGLPMPNPQQLEIEQDKTQNKVLSPMYVYI